MKLLQLLLIAAIVGASSLSAEYNILYVNFGDFALSVSYPVDYPAGEILSFSLNISALRGVHFNYCKVTFKLYTENASEVLLSSYILRDSYLSEGEVVIYPISFATPKNMNGTVNMLFSALTNSESIYSVSVNLTNIRKFTYSFAMTFLRLYVLHARYLLENSLAGWRLAALFGVLATFFLGSTVYLLVKRAKKARS